MTPLVAANLYTDLSSREMFLVEEEAQRLTSRYEYVAPAINYAPEYSDILRRFIESVSIGACGRTIDLSIESASQAPLVGKNAVQLSLDDWTLLSDRLFSHPTPLSLDERRVLDATYLAGAKRVELSAPGDLTRKR